MCPSDLRSHHSTQTVQNDNNNNVSNDNNNDDNCNIRNNNSNNDSEHDDNDHDDTTTNKSKTEISKRPTSSKSANEQEQDATSSTTTSTSTSINFPRLLHEIISDPQTDHLVHWLPGGTHFYISDKKRFASEILSTARFGHAKFASFIRRLKRWGFVRIPSGPLMGAYFHLGFRKGEAVALELGKCPKAGGVVGGENALAALAVGGGRCPRRHGDVMAMAMMNNALRNGGSNANDVAFGNGHPNANLNSSFDSMTMTVPLANPQGSAMGAVMPPPFDCADAARFASLSPNSFQNRNLNFSHSINGVHNHMISNGINNGINNGIHIGIHYGINNNHMINYGNHGNNNQMFRNNNLMINGTNNNNNNHNYNNNNTFHSDPPPGSMEHSLRQRLLQMSNNRNKSPLSSGAARMSSSSVSMSSAGNSNHAPFSQAL